MSNIERNRIAPKLRKGEVLPTLPEGFVPTRVDGSIIGVSAAETGDTFVGKYTERQLRQIDLYKNRTRNLPEEQQAALDEAESVLFHHQRDQIQEAQQTAIQADIFLRDEQKKYVTVEDAMFVVESYFENAEFYKNVWRNIDAKRSSQKDKDI